MNVLITCVGRRSYLVRYFKEAVEPLGGSVVTANSEPFAAGLIFGDRHYLVPTINSDEYLPTLLDICTTEKIHIILSLFDIDLALLAASYSTFLDVGSRVIISNPKVIATANDKLETYRFLSKNGMPVPKTWLATSNVIQEMDRDKAFFPLIVKPRWGMGSIGVMKVQSREELSCIVDYVRRLISDTYVSMMSPHEIECSVIVQEFIPGDEYGADVFNDLDGNHLTSVIKRKIAMRNGETDAAVTVHDPALTRLCFELSRRLRHSANLDVDIVRSEDGVARIIEFNARFGGGYPFSHLAGAQFPRAIVQMASGKKPDPGHARSGVYALKDCLPIEYPFKDEQSAD